MPGNIITARFLGYAGLIPFIVFSIASWIPLPTISDAISILIAYAAVILTFIGAVHWGIVMSRNDDQQSIHLIASVIPSLIGWSALLMTQTTGLLILLSGFIIQIFYDWSVDEKLDLPEWYVPMRIQLTLVVTICLTATLMAVGAS